MARYNTASKPSPAQFTARRGKTRSWQGWERGLVYNPDKQSFRIRKIAKIEKGTRGAIAYTNSIDKPVDPAVRYLNCKLPLRQKSVELFREGDQVTTASGQKEGKIFIGALDLRRLSFMDQVSRFVGQLRTLYIVNSPSSETSLRSEPRASSLI